ncbi:MAG: hypothetical protein WC401_11240, partial [Bacteroidales bacterium]|jgi:hypothetical protein
MPTDTTAMKYDYIHHKWILQIEYLKNELGLDFIARAGGSETKAKDDLYQITVTIYDYIYTHTHNKTIMEYWLATDPLLFPVLQEALEQQARYEMKMSAEYFSLQFGTNILNGVHNPLINFRGDVSIAPKAINVLRNNKLLYSGRRVGLISEYNYITDGY